MNSPVEDYLIRFVARKESPDDVQKLKKWLSADPSHRTELKQWLAVWDTAGMTCAPEIFSPGRAYQRFMLRI